MNFFVCGWVEKVGIPLGTGHYLSPVGGGGGRSENFGGSLDFWENRRGISRN